MLTRIITSVIGLPILIALITVGGLTLKVGIVIMALVGMYELYNINGNKPVYFLGYTFAVFYILFIDVMSVNQLLVFNNAFIVMVLICLVLLYDKINISDCAITILGFFYVAVLLTNVYLVRERSFGDFFVWLIFISAWGCDTGAYFCGLKFGKRKLAPRLSPKKTVEGAIGGVFTATILGFVYGFAITRFSNIEAPNIIFLCAVSCGIGSIFAQLGDLTASAIKRFTNIKDFGKIFPGHGGVLDRFDSILFTAPGVYLVTYLLMLRR